MSDVVHRVEKADDEDFLELNSDGTLDVSAYSYYIDTTGSFTLTKSETFELYEALKELYENNFL